MASRGDWRARAGPRPCLVPSRCGARANELCRGEQARRLGAAWRGAAMRTRRLASYMARSTTSRAARRTYSARARSPRRLLVSTRR